jgi:hypothetical protein
VHRSHANKRVSYFSFGPVFLLLYAEGRRRRRNPAEVFSLDSLLHPHDEDERRKNLLGFLLHQQLPDCARPIKSKKKKAGQVLDVTCHHEVELASKDASFILFLSRFPVVALLMFSHASQKRTHEATCRSVNKHLLRPICFGLGVHNEVVVDGASGR